MKNQRKVRELFFILINGNPCKDMFLVSQPAINLFLYFAGEFSFFTVFDVVQFELFSAVIRKLGSGIPNKTKFVVGFSREKKISEALQVLSHHPFPPLGEILNKRWQTLDLVSMIQELKRLSYVARLWSFGGIFIEDTLSSLPRFKRAEDLS